MWVQTWTGKNDVVDVRLVQAAPPLPPAQPMPPRPPVVGGVSAAAAVSPSDHAVWKRALQKMSIHQECVVVSSNVLSSCVIHCVSSIVSAEAIHHECDAQPDELHE